MIEVLAFSLQVNAAFEGHVDDCNVDGFMHALGYTTFTSEGLSLQYAQSTCLILLSLWKPMHSARMTNTFQVRARN